MYDSLVVRLAGLIENHIPQKYVANDLIDVIVELIEYGGYLEGSGDSVVELVAKVLSLKEE